MSIKKITEEYSRELMLFHLSYDITSVFFSWMYRKFKTIYYDKLNNNIISYNDMIEKKEFCKFFESYSTKYLYQKKDSYQLDFPNVDVFYLFRNIRDMYEQDNFSLKNTLLKIGENINLTEEEINENILKSQKYIKCYGEEAFKTIKKMDEILFDFYKQSYNNSFYELFGIKIDCD